MTTFSPEPFRLSRKTEICVESPEVAQMQTFIDAYTRHVEIPHTLLDERLLRYVYASPLEVVIYLTGFNMHWMGYPDTYMWFLPLLLVSGLLRLPSGA